jgi:hypothetical protein
MRALGFGMGILSSELATYNSCTYIPSASRSEHMVKRTIPRLPETELALENADQVAEKMQSGS